MANVANTNQALSAQERAMVFGDISGLDERGRMEYLKFLCESIGLNPASRAFGYMTLQGVTTLYLTAQGGAQLRLLHNVSITDIVDEGIIGNFYRIKIFGKMANGRTDVEIGSVSITDKYGKRVNDNELENRRKRCITQSKTRLTKSLVGLSGILSEEEAETVQGAVIPRQDAGPVYVQDQRPLERSEPLRLPASRDQYTDRNTGVIHAPNGRTALLDDDDWTSDGWDRGTGRYSPQPYTPAPLPRRDMSGVVSNVIKGLPTIATDDDDLDDDDVAFGRETTKPSPTAPAPIKQKWQVGQPIPAKNTAPIFGETKPPVVTPAVVPSVAIKTVPNAPATPASAIQRDHIQALVKQMSGGDADASEWFDLVDMSQSKAVEIIETLRNDIKESGEIPVEVQTVELAAPAGVVLPEEPAVAEDDGPLASKDQQRKLRVILSKVGKPVPSDDILDGMSAASVMNIIRQEAENFNKGHKG